MSIGLGGVTPGDCDRVILGYAIHTCREADSWKSNLAFCNLVVVYELIIPGVKSLMSLFLVHPSVH